MIGLPRLRAGAPEAKQSNSPQRSQIAGFTNLVSLYYLTMEEAHSWKMQFLVSTKLGKWVCILIYQLPCYHYRCIEIPAYRHGQCRIWNASKLLYISWYTGIIYIAQGEKLSAHQRLVAALPNFTSAVGTPLWYARQPWATSAILFVHAS